MKLGFVFGSLSRRERGMAPTVQTYIHTLRSYAFMRTVVRKEEAKEEEGPSAVSDLIEVSSVRLKKRALDPEIYAESRLSVHRRLFFSSNFKTRYGDFLF